ncbi:nucleolar protein 12-domain-containing protein [Coprinopsis sp. MPI-PUGE-AT-0042]|nr:nucleolar protein 12-domain-containing protein [Coprinopsis sp. MPI-PUGE-AT-0042]
MQTNIATLTQSSKVGAAKRRAKRNEIKEVLFDDEARREFLTGFHKRKKAKADAARQKAKEREKQERLEERREIRKELRERATQNAAEVERAYADLLGRTDQDLEDDEWDGVGTSTGGREQDEEYEGEQVVATVTVVEDFDPTTITTGPIPPPRPSLNEDRVVDSTSTRLAKPTSPKVNKPKPRTKKISYQTKDARKHERSKQHARKLEKAALAGRRDKSTKKRGKPRR